MFAAHPPNQDSLSCVPAHGTFFPVCLSLHLVAWGLRQTFNFVPRGDIIVLISTLSFFYAPVDTVRLKRIPMLSFVSL